MDLCRIASDQTQCPNLKLRIQRVGLLLLCFGIIANDVATSYESGFRLLTWHFHYGSSCFAFAVTSWMFWRAHCQSRGLATRILAFVVVFGSMLCCLMYAWRAISGRHPLSVPFSLGQTEEIVLEDKSLLGHTYHDWLGDTFGVVLREHDVAPGVIWTERIGFVSEPVSAIEVIHDRGDVGFRFSRYGYELVEIRDP